MNWYASVIFYLGIFDAGVIMLGGLVTSGIILFGLDAEKLWERIWPATFALVGSNVAAALVLGGVRWLMGT